MSATSKPFSKPMNVAVRHGKGEPPYGVLLRTAHRNGRIRPHAIFERAGLVSGQGVSDLDPDRVAFLCRQDPDEMRRAAPRVTPACVAILADKIGRDHFSVVHRRWCPDCLAEADHHRVWWDVLYFIACPEHECRIAEECGCPTRPRWKSGAPLECGQQHDLRQVARVPALAHEIGLSAFVRARLLDERARCPTMIDESPTLGRALEVLDMLGLASLTGRRDLVDLRKRRGRGAVAAEGFRILSDWPAAYEDLLDRLVAGASARGGGRQWGLEHAYGPFYPWLDQYVGAPAVTGPLREFLAHHARNKVTLMTARKVAGIDVEPTPGLTLVEAAAECGMTFERFRRIATAMDMLPSGSVRGRPVRLDGARIRELASSIQGSRTGDQVGAELGIAGHLAVDLIEAGLLNAVVSGGRKRGNRTNVWLVDGKAATGLLDRLRGAAGRDRVDAPLMASLPGAARIARAPLAEVLRLALNGKLAIRGQDATGIGLQSLFVSTSETKLALRRDRTPGLTLTEATHELRVPHTMALRLCEAGLLAASRHGRMWIVRAEDVQAFRERHIRASELAPSLGVSVRAVPGALARVGVEPVCGPPGFGLTLYDRTAALGGVERHLAQPRAAKDKEAHWRHSGEWLTRKAAAAHMGIDPIVVSQLVEANLVEAERLAHGYRMPSATADAFRSAFVGTTELAPMLDRKEGSVVKAVLRRAGVEPLCATPRFNATIYPREAAQAAIRAHVEREARSRQAADAARRAKAQGSMLTSGQVRDILGMPDTMLAQVCRATHLVVRIHGIKAGRGLVYDAEEVARFGEEYVLGCRIATLVPGSGATFRGNAGMLLLRSLGVEPVCRRPEYQSFLFPRREAEVALKRHFAGLVASIA